MMIYRDFIREKSHHLTRVKSAHGYPCEFDNSAGRALKDYKIYGNSVQEGTPTPDAPVAICSVGDLVTDETSEYYGKYKVSVINLPFNLFEGNREYKLTDFTNCTPANLYQFIKPGKTYTMFAYIDNTEGTVVARMRMSVGKTEGWDYIYSSNVAPGAAGYTIGKFTPPNNYNNSLNFQLVCTGSNTYKDIMIVEGIYTIEELTSKYSRYFNPISVDIYLDEPLRKFKDYVDYIDFKNKKVVRNVAAGVLNGSENWQPTAKRYYYYNAELNVKCLGNGVAGIKSNALFSAAWNWIRNSGTGIATYTNGTLHGRIDIRADGVWSTVDEAKAYMADNPIEYIAPCLEPVEEDISLPKILTQKGINIIKVQTAIEPSDIEIKYIVK